MSEIKDKVLKALSTVLDPDLKKDLVTLNMVADIQVDGKTITLDIALTTPACPLKDVIQGDIEGAISKVLPEFNTKVVFSSKVQQARTDKKDVLKGVKNIIAVSSGKGGVGKSTVSVQLALSLSKLGASVGIIDADIYGPSIPTMLGINGRSPKLREEDGKTKLEPIEVDGLKVLSLGLMLKKDQAVVWRGPMASSALTQFITDCDWGELDYLIFDTPPGTGDIHISLTGLVPITGAIIVTTPQDIALADARRAMSMYKIDQINVPVLGVVENMSWFTPAELPDNKYYIFGQGGAQKLCTEFDVPLLGQIPLIQSVQDQSDKGIMSQVEEISPVFLNFAQSVAQQLSILNANKPQEAGVE